MKTTRAIVTALAATVLLAAGSGLFACKKKEPETIKIGAILPLTGEQASYGVDIKRAVELAVKKRDGGGGIQGRKIEIIYEDYRGVPSLAVSGSQKLINTDKVKVIIGAFGSSATLAVAPIAEENHVILFSPSSSASEITDSGDYIFRNEVSEEYGAMASAESYLSLGYEAIAILFINNDYGVGVEKITREVYESRGGTITASESFEENETDFRAQLTKIKETKPEGILIVGYKQMIQIMKQIKELGLEQQVLSTPMFEDPEILEAIGEIADGVIYTYYGIYSPEGTAREVRDFVSEYKGEYGVAPSYYAALGYDAINIIIAAMEKGGYDADSMKDALYGTQDYPGVTGNTSFDSSGDVVKPVSLKTVSDGRFVFYAPPGK